MKKIILVLIAAFVLISCGGEETEDTVLCPENDIFCHKAGGLSWTDRSENTMNWDDATKYCADLKGNLPTVDELRLLIQNCSDTKKGGKCAVSSECLSIDCIDECKGCEWNDSGEYSLLGDKNTLWSSTVKEESDNSIFIVGFFNASIKITNKSAFVYVRCIQSK